MLEICGGEDPPSKLTLPTFPLLTDAVGQRNRWKEAEPGDYRLVMEPRP
jgi:hypothetical protein